jgi:uncharacterized protein YbaP (TraB family)
MAICFVLPMLSEPLLGADHPVTLWQVDGDTNSVFILGSIHLLRKSDYPIPSVIYGAYDEAEVLIMELDMDDMDPMQTQALVRELGMIADGKSLEDEIGSRAYAKAAALADELEIPLSMLAGSKPWLAAVMVETLILTRVGFDPMQGIEMHLMTRASRDGKEILGLETERQQLEMLNGLSLAAQRDMLLQTLEDGGHIEKLLDEIIDAWRQGDTRYMEQTLLSDMSGYDELYDTIVVDRNRDWVRQIDRLLDDSDDYLIVVGTMHLVGKDGVPQLLKKRGHQVTQMQQTIH